MTKNWQVVLKIKDRGDHGWRTKDILGGPKSWDLKKVGKIMIFVVFAFYRRKTETTFKCWKDWVTRHILFGVFIIIGRLSIGRRRKG